MVKEDFTKPFCIIGSKGKFWEGYTTSLPALELPQEEPESTKVEYIHIYEHSNTSSKQEARISKLENQYSSLKKILQGYLNKTKVDKQRKSPQHTLKEIYSNKGRGGGNINIEGSK